MRRRIVTLRQLNSDKVGKATVDQLIDAAIQAPTAVHHRADLVSTSRE
jgi:hypothetical protein